MEKIVEKTSEKPSEKTPQTASKHFKDLILLFSIPIGISLLAAAIVYVPRALANPQTDFLYSYCDDYDCKDPYSAASDGRVTKSESKSRTSTEQDFYSTGYRAEAKLGYYDVSTGAVRVISYQEAQQYQLVASSVSPDGYSLKRGGEDGGLLFGGGSDRHWYLQDGMKKRPVELLESNTYYDNDINFLGWVRQ